MTASITSELTARMQALLQHSSRQVLSGDGASSPFAGTVLRGLPVVENRNEQGGQDRGVLINGKFFAVELPEGISNGDRVDVKVVLSEGQLKAIFQARSAADPTGSDPRQRALDALLKTLDLNHESLSALRTVLSTLPEVSKGVQSGQALPERLIRFLKQAGVVDLLALGSDESSPFNKLARELPATTSKAVFETLKIRDRAVKTGVESSRNETIRRLISELEALDVDLEAPQKRGDLSVARKPAFRDVNSEVATREQIKQLAPTFDRILNLLKGGRGERNAADLQELEAFRRSVLSQLTQLKLVEGKVNVLLRDIGGAGTLGDLVTVLDSLRKATDNLPDGISKLLNAFARDLLKGIQGALSHTDDTSALRSILEQGLKQLYETFGLTPFDQRILLPDDTANPSIPHELRGMLRLLESQIVTILADPEIEKNVQDLLDGKSNQLFGKIKIVQSHFEDALKDIIDLGHEDMKPLQQKVQQSLKVFERLLNPDAVTSSQEELSGASFKAMLTDLNESVRQFSGFELEKGDWGGSFSRSGLPVQKIVYQLERHLLNLLRAGDGDAPDTESIVTFQRLVDLIAEAQEGAAPIGNRPPATGGQPIQNLKLLLQQLALELPASGSPAEEQLADAVYDLGMQLDQLEPSAEKKVSGDLKPRLQQTLVKLHQSLEQSGTSSKQDSILASVDAESLKRAGSVLAAQETLLRMAPIMKALGEPVLLFFPFIMGNFLSRAQCTFYADSDLHQGDADGQHGLAAERFTRLKVVVPFPEIGRVLADVAYRSGEILINLGYENHQVAEYVEARLLLLRKALQGAGFQKIELATAMVSEEAFSGDIVDADSLRQVFQMSTQI